MIARGLQDIGTRERFAVLLPLDMWWRTAEDLASNCHSVSGNHLQFLAWHRNLWWLYKLFTTSLIAGDYEPVTSRKVSASAFPTLFSALQE